MTALLVRPMQAHDLPALHALQCRAYAPGYHEPEAALASRLGAPGALCFVAWRGTQAAGYVFAHPWAGTPPALHAALPSCGAPDHLFIHDLAVCPAQRGSGAAAGLLDRLLNATQAAGLAQARLVAVADAVAFWQRHGFAAQPGTLHASYGRALYMARTLSRI
ncbi:MAG: GNAT family N-acetyltransferase [Rhodocyclaceae bacterium]